MGVPPNHPLIGGMMVLPSGVIKHGLLENGPFIADLHIKTSIGRGFSIAMFDYQRVQRFLWGYPKFSSMLIDGFPSRKHPAIGVPPFMETTQDGSICLV